MQREDYLQEKENSIGNEEDGSVSHKNEVVKGERIIKEDRGKL